MVEDEMTDERGYRCGGSKCPEGVDCHNGVLFCLRPKPFSRISIGFRKQCNLRM